MPGDPIVGFITRGLGVSIHRSDCVNYKRDVDTGRWIDVSWAENTNDTYSAEVRLLSDERSGFVMDIATILNSMNAKVRSLSAHDTGHGTSTAVIILDDHDREELQTIMNKLQTIRGLREITRSGSV